MSAPIWPPPDPRPPTGGQTPAAGSQRPPRNAASPSRTAVSISAAGPWTRLPDDHDPRHDDPVLQDGVFRAAVAAINTALAERLAAAEGDQVRAWAVITAAVRDWAEQQATGGRLLLGAADRSRLAEAVWAERFGFGPLQPYLADDRVEQIDVNGPGEVWVRYAGTGKVAVPAIADTDEEVTDLVRRICARAGGAREFSPARPMVNVSLGVGVRMTATMRVTPGTHISIRKHRMLAVTLEDLVAGGTLDEIQAAFLTAAVRARLDIMITGGQAVGKTTFLRALASVFDPMERVVTLESEEELYLKQVGHLQDVAPLEAKEANQEGVGAITLFDLFPQALRMNADRILVGEVRHREMLALLQAINAGAEGTITTLHANSGEEVFGRILTLCAYAPGAPRPDDLFRLIGRAVDLVVHLKRDRASGDRFVSEIIEVLPPGSTPEPSINRIFKPGPGGRAVPTGFTPKVIDELEAEGFDRRLLATRPDRPPNGHTVSSLAGWNRPPGGDR